MSNLKTLQQYIQDHQSNMTLVNAAGGILLKTQGTSFENQIFVIDGKTDLSSLAPGYYLRFMDRGKKGFHIYGIEVPKTGLPIVHENIPRSQLKSHEDKDHLEQLLTLDKKNQVYYRVALRGEGISAHEDLVEYYAKNGVVGKYLNKQICLSIAVPSPKLDFVKEDPIKLPESLDESPEPFEESPEPPKVQPKIKIKLKAKKSYNTNLMLTIGAGVMAAAGSAALIVGMLALTGVFTGLAIPVACALSIGGGLTLAVGTWAFRFFGDKYMQNTSFEPDDPDFQLDP